MKKLLSSTILGFLTISSLALTVSPRASALTSRSNVFNEILPQKTSPTNPKPDTNISRATNDQTVAFLDPTECPYACFDPPPGDYDPYWGWYW